MNQVNRRPKPRQVSRLFDSGVDAVLSHAPHYARQGILSARRPLRTMGADLSRDPRNPRPFSPTALPSVLGSPVQYLIITNDDMQAQFQPLCTRMLPATLIASGSA